MTGWMRVRGAPSHYYSTKDENEWPPRFVKFILKIAEPKTKPSLEGSLIPEIWGTEIAFVDARRLGRVRLVDAEDPFTVAYCPTEGFCVDGRPLNELGFDPILKMPEFEWFAGTVVKRKVPIKALLLDQSFSAGVGNWVAYAPP
jgi:formamidopyrimidine-DNA glycosylase